MVIVFLCIYCAKIAYNNELFPARKHLTPTHAQLTVSVINISGMVAISVLFFQWIRPNLMRKITKSKWNYTVNIIMNVSGTVCQLIHYFHSKQWLAIDPTWPALKVNNTLGFDISWSFCLFIFLFWWSTLTNYWKHFPQSICIEFISPVGYFFNFFYYWCYGGWGNKYLSNVFYKKTDQWMPHTGLKYLNAALILFIMPLICQGERGWGIFYFIRIVFVFLSSALFF